MINNSTHILGNENEVIVWVDDFEKKQQMKYKESTKEKGMKIYLKNQDVNLFG